MKKLLITTLILALSFPAFARGGRSGSHHSGGSHVNRGGHYAGGKGSSHKGGHYKNSKTNDHYQKRNQ
jgi:hypothetical protein